MTPTVTLKELLAEFDKGKVRQADLRYPLAHLDGLCDFEKQRVYVNPKPAVVETLLHELIHRKHRRWSEQRVDREAKELLARMTTREINAWYRKFQAEATKLKTPIRVEDE